MHLSRTCSACAAPTAHTSHTHRAHPRTAQPHQQCCVSGLLAAQHPHEGCEAQPPAAHSEQHAAGLRLPSCTPTEACVGHHAASSIDCHTLQQQQCKPQSDHGQDRENRHTATHRTCACGTRVQHSTARPCWCAEATRQRRVSVYMKAMPGGGEAGR